MKKKTAFVLALMILLTALLLPVSQAETREATIFLEGQEEMISETLYVSPLGFSFWYADDRLEAYPGDAGDTEGVVVSALYSDDAMTLSMIPEEDAQEYVEDLGWNIAERSAGTRVQTDIYRELEDGRYYFLILIAENGKYMRAVGDYAEEAAEGNARFLSRVLDSVSFGAGSSIRVEWGEEEPDEEGFTQVILMALEPVTEVSLLRLDWEGTEPSWQAYAPLGSFSAQQKVAVTLRFMGDMPENGLQYTDAQGIEHACAVDISGENGDLYLWELGK